MRTPVSGLSFEFEYAREDNGDTLASTAWTLQGAYELSDITWTPTLSYRYAFFQGDDPATAGNEAFDPLFPGFHDWGQWWQGEIAGEILPLELQPDVAHGARARGAERRDRHRPVVLPVQSRSAGFVRSGRDRNGVAFEVDWYLDWKINTHFTASVVAAYADPGEAVQQAFDRTKNFAYGMVYLAYSF